mgnify:CR=1 FL=1
MMRKIIYKVTNKKTNQIYIGATAKSITNRKKDHLKKSKKSSTRRYAFQQAISEYGMEAFKWEQIDTAVSLDDLAKKEKEYILKYNSQQEGYNADAGGGIQKTVYQYDIATRCLLNTYDNLTTAGAVINLKKNGLSNVCLGVNQVAGGFYWSYEKHDIFPLPNDSRRKKVRQYTTEGDFVNEYESVAEASKQTGCNKTCIAKVCRGNRLSSGGFKWEYSQV